MTSRPVLVYTVLRLLAFLVPLGVLWLLFPDFPLVAAVMAAAIGASLSILFLIHPSEKTPVSIYEISRLMRGQPILRDAPVLHIRTQTSAPRAMTDPSERLLARMLADRLRLPPAHVLLYLNDGDQKRYDQFNREIALYGRDGQVDPFIVRITERV